MEITVNIVPFSLNKNQANTLQGRIAGNFDTVGDLKIAISSIMTIPMEMCLFFAYSNQAPTDAILLSDNSKKLSDYAIMDGSSVTVRRKMIPQAVEISAMFEGWAERKKFQSTDRVFEIMKWVEQEFSIPPRRQFLQIYHSKMDSEMKLEDYFTGVQGCVGVSEIQRVRDRMVTFVVKIRRRGTRKTSRCRQIHTMENRDTLHMVILNVQVKTGWNNWKEYSFSMNGKENLEKTGLSLEELGVVNGSELDLVLVGGLLDSTFMYPPSMADSNIRARDEWMELDWKAKSNLES